LKLLKLLLQVLAYAQLTKVANGPSQIDFPQKELSNETLRNNEDKGSNMRGVMSS